MSHKLSATTVTKKDITPPSIPEAKKLVSVSATSTPVTDTQEETVETVKAVETAEVVETAKAVETAGTDKDGKESEGKYLENIILVPCIRYPITFRKKSVPVSVLFDSDSGINAINPTFARELGLPIRPTDVGAQKIVGTMLDTFGMVVAAFSVINKANQVRFFKKTFLMANINLKVVFGMLFVTLSGANIDFLGRELW